MKFLYNPPVILKSIFSDFIWQTANNKILLTFDDGPNSDITEQIISSLNKNKIKALFFCVGSNLKFNKSLTNEMIDEGHTIGNHTYNHNRLTEMNFNESIEEINSLNELMMEEHNYPVKYFRPPHGRITSRTNKIMKATGMKCVMWNMLTYDYKKELKKVKFSIDKYLQKDSIIVLHDSIKTEKFIPDAIEYIVEKVSERDFKFGEPEECLN